MIDEQVLKDLFADHKRGRFEIKAVLGAGAMGTVVRARDTRLKLPRAIKVFNPELLEHKDLIQRFENEASIMAGIDHPNIVRVFDIAEVEGHFYIVLEWIGGGSLSDHTYIYGGMPARQAVEVIFDVCSALEKAHLKGVIHRDIKPDNILLTNDGIVKVADFGIAHINDEDRRLTGAQQTLGTLGYMSPEQVYEAATVDERSDLHGVAVMLWALMSAKHPPGTSFINDIEHHPELLDCVPKILHPIIKKATAYSPKERYQTLQGFVFELKTAFSELPELPEDTPVLGSALDHKDPSEPRPDLITPTDANPGATFVPDKTEVDKQTMPHGLKLIVPDSNKSESATDPGAVSIVSANTTASPKRVSETEVYSRDRSSSSEKEKPIAQLVEQTQAQKAGLVVIEGGKVESPEPLKMVPVNSFENKPTGPQTMVSYKQSKKKVEEKKKPRAVLIASFTIFVLGAGTLAYVYANYDSPDTKSVQTNQLAGFPQEPEAELALHEPDASSQEDAGSVEKAPDVSAAPVAAKISEDVAAPIKEDASPTKSVVVPKPVLKNPSIQKPSQVEKKKVKPKRVRKRAVKVRVGLKMTGGGLSTIWLVSSKGRFKLPGKVPVGKYRVVANFADHAKGATAISSFEVKKGDSKRIVCNSVFAKCKIR